MRELEYPFDSAYIMKKRKSLRRSLLSDGSARIKKRIAVLGGSTTDDIVSAMELFLLNMGIEPAFYQSEYGQYWQDAMFPGEELLSFNPDVIFVHTTNRNITEYPNVCCDKQAADKLLAAEFERFVRMWDELHSRFHCPIIQNNFELPMYRLMGNRDCFDFRGRERFITRLNEKFYEYAENSSNFYINDINYISSCYGLEKWSSPLYWNMYKYALCFEAIPEFAFNTANIIKSIFGKNKKAIALDLDNTLWGGVVGDDGVEHIQIGQETGVAQSYCEFQSYLKSQSSLGVLLTICSKNDEENALAGLNHPEGVLRPSDFVVIKANWENKDVNIARTAEQLGILTDSIVFVDDNPAERAIVKAQLPGVSVPDMDGVENYIRTLDRSGFFEITTLSGDDLSRSEMYRANAERAAQKAKFEDYSDYLRSLEMTAVIDDFAPMYIERITQLTNKSNQFNLTTKRYTAAEMESIFADSGYIRLYGKLVDKFGDNGVVSVVIGRISGSELNIELWLMSCRVLKRDMELAMLDTLAAKCKVCGIKTIKGYYYPTAKNKMVRELYGSFGFEKLSEDEQGNSVWQLAVDGYENKNQVIAVCGNK